MSSVLGGDLFLELIFFVMLIGVSVWIAEFVWKKTVEVFKNGD